MASTPFNIASDEPEISAGLLDNAATGVINGYLVEWSSGELVLANDGPSVAGLVYSTKQEILPYTLQGETDANNITVMAGRQVGLIVGDVTVVVGSGHFESVTGLVEGDMVTASTSAPGKYKKAVSTNLILGRVIDILTNQYSTTLYAVRFNIPANQVMA